VSLIYVTGHRNPDTDSIASAIGYAELKGRLDPNNEYRPVRLGPLNSQTRWVLERSGAPEPVLLPHVMLRSSDVMQTSFPVMGEDRPLREAGLAMARADLDLVPIVDVDGALTGIVTERALARRYIRESRRTSTLEDAPTFISAIVEVLEGKLMTGEDAQLAGRVIVHSMAVGSPSQISDGDVVVVGNRRDAQKLAIELGAALIVTSNGSEPDDEILALASERGTAVVVSPLDTYVSARMITLAAPCRSFMEHDPLTTTADDLLVDISEQVKEIHYGAAVFVDAHRQPLGLITRTNLVAPQPRRVILVDHAEQAQSAPGIEHAEIVEILDHHHIGSIETRIPVMATFDPVGSTATLVIERFRQAGMEPRHETAILLLGAILSDTVILNSPTTTERDHSVIEYLERVLAVDATELGREMFESSADMSDVSAEEIIGRDAKEYQIRGGQTICIAQVEVVGKSLLEREPELLRALDQARVAHQYAIYALMITDVLSKGTDLLVAGERAQVERALEVRAHNGVIELPGVMSRKKQVAPKLLEAL
jgi:manganese-dependent inorganic pyrophosphatase